MAEEKNAASISGLEGVPQYAIDHAPLLHLFSNDPYRPSSLAAQLTNTTPQIDFKPTAIPSPPLTLANLLQLNALGSNGGKDVHLTSTIDPATLPKWLEGITPNASGRVGNGDDKTSVVIVVDKGSGVVDVFYFYFYAFNWGGVVLGKQLGDHVGDWEHNMIRFENGIPKAVWLSQHASGKAYTFDCLTKDASGKRPLLFSAHGTHALYPTPGLHDHTIPPLPLPFPLLLVDETDPGPLYDPLLSCFAYAYTPTSSFSFTPYDPDSPTGFLDFAGRWGDAEYPESDERQKGNALFGFKKYVSGPTGPRDKGLVRREVWPDGVKGVKVKKSLGLGWWARLMAKVGWRGRKMRGVRRVKVTGEVVR